MAEFGRRARLRIWCPKGCGSSSLPPRTKSTLIFPHILPVSRLALRQPFDCRAQPLLPRILSFCFGDPFHVILLVAVAKVLKRLQCLFIFANRIQEIGGNL